MTSVMFKEYESQFFSHSALVEQTGLYPEWVGRLKASENYHCNSRILDDYFLIYVKEGTGVLHSADMKFELLANSLFFLFPGILHSYYTSRKDLLSLAWIGFNGFMANIILGIIGVHPGNPVIKLKETESNELSELIKELILSDNKKESLYLTGTLYKIFGLIIDSEQEIPTKIHSKIADAKNSVERALSYIDKNFTSQISVTELASYVNMSRTAFSKHFKKDTGHSPQTYLIEVRMTQAEHLLVSNMSIKDIAYAVGFNDEYYFSRCFKNKHGVSPREFRKSLKANSKTTETDLRDKTWL